MKVSWTQEFNGRRLTWQARLILSVAVLIALIIGVANLYRFLAPSAPPHKGLMVMEGWIHDFALDEAVAIYRQGEYTGIVCTGVPIETGSYIQQYSSYPEMTAARLRHLGIPDDRIIIAVAEDQRKDRTYLSAVALRQSFMAYNIGETNLHLVTTGAHGRRSRMLFRKALGPEYNIGITCLEENDYSPEDWYTCSSGVRSVIGELIAYVYAALFFHP